MKKLWFTLLELLIVISIIIILASLLLPMLSKAKELSKRVGCQNNLKQLANACFVYASDFNGWGPCDTDDGYGYLYSPTSISGYLITPGANEARNLVCPGTKEPFLSSPVYHAGKIISYRVYSSYILSFGTGNRSQTATGYWHGWIFRSAPDCYAQCPNLNMVGRAVSSGGLSRYVETASRSPLAGDIASANGIISILSASRTLQMAHSMGANTIFMDGHLSWTAKNNFISYVHYYYSNARIYW